MRHELTEQELSAGRKKGSSPKSRKKAEETRQKTILIKKAVDDAIRTLLTEEDGDKGKPYFVDFLSNFLLAAKRFPNSQAGLFMAERLVPKDTLTELDSADEKDALRDIAFQRYRLLEDFFREQRDVILDTNHQKKLIACCSRRAGKTDLASGAILYASLVPGSRIIYVNLTFTNAINQIWKNVIERSDKIEALIKTSSKSEGMIEWANGSSLRIMGNPNNSEIEKLRGEAKVSLVVIDEFFHQKNMDYALNEVISPLMTDRADSTLLCIGTPPRLAKTYGERAWNEGGWKKYHWTMWDNPYIPDPTKYLEDYCRDRGISKDSPFVRREYFGEIGVYDTEALVFKGRKTHSGNITEEVASGRFRITDIAIGVDYGWTDYNSVVAVAYDRDGRKSAVFSERKFNHASVSEIVRAISDAYKESTGLCKKAGIIARDHVKIYCDTNEESITAELVTRHKLPAFNCYKYDKAFALELLAEELRTGRMTIPEGGELDDEMANVLYKRDKDTDAIIPEIDEEEGIHPDAAMALLYASRKVFFDMGLDDRFKERKPRTSDFIVDESGTMIEPIVGGINDGDFENMGTIG